MLFMALTWSESRNPRCEGKIRERLLDRSPLGRLSISGLCVSLRTQQQQCQKLSISEHESIKVKTSGLLHPIVVCGVWV